MILITLCFGCLTLGWASAAYGWVDLGTFEVEPRDHPYRGHVVDGSYVMNVGELHINITNHGLIGSQYSVPSSYADAPSAQWPAGSGVEYLWSAGLWVGGVINGQIAVSTGQYEREFRPLRNPQDTIYETIEGKITRPPGNPGSGMRMYLPDGDDDQDTRYDEETPNGYDDDDDGLIDEDFGQVGDQMMVCTMYDNTPVAMASYPDHNPMNLKVVQKSYAWMKDDIDDFVGFDYEITNIGSTTIWDMYCGFFVDCDIGPRGLGDNSGDDLAGFWDGFVRSSAHSFVPVRVAYMYDAALDNRVDGYFGMVIFDYTTDWNRRYGPNLIRVRSYQQFSGQRPFHMGGDPTNDTERYQLMSRNQIDPNARPTQENDYRFLITAGPWHEVPPGFTVTLRVAMVMGHGLQDLIQNCMKAGKAAYGRWYDLDHQHSTGVAGRETKVCLDEFPLQPNGFSVLHKMSASFFDKSCLPPLEELGLSVPLIAMTDLFYDENMRRCIYVNADNCIECERRTGGVCDEDHRNALLSGCNRAYWGTWLGCTAYGGKETHVPWFYLGVLAPPPPGMRLWPQSHKIHVFWDDRSEHAKDELTDTVDFESYRIYRAANWDRPLGTSIDHGPPSNLWEMIVEYDKVDYYIYERVVPGHVDRDTLALGANTGFDAVIYRPICLDDPLYAGLAEAMQAFVHRDSLGAHPQLPPLRDHAGGVVPGLEELVRWESYPAVLDTFFMVASRISDPAHGIVGKRSVRFYEYVDQTLLNGFLYFYSVVATDHELDDQGRIVGYGQEGDPRSSFASAVPGSVAQTPAERHRNGVNIYVYPNPATSESLSEFQQMEPNPDDPTGVRVRFANLPQAHNHIKIFTLDGDFVADLDHDGTTGYGELSWNLVSRNGQQVVSGVYLYSVQSDDDRFDDFVGKFVVIR